MHALWGLGQAMVSKVIVVVDADVNIRDYSELTWKFSTTSTRTGHRIRHGTHRDSGPRQPPAKYGSKMGIDGTRKWPEEGFTRVWPDEIIMEETVKRLVDRRWAEYGLP